jgi:hypothetical protein
VDGSGVSGRVSPVSVYWTFVNTLPCESQNSKLLENWTSAEFTSDDWASR